MPLCILAGVPEYRYKSVLKTIQCILAMNACFHLIGQWSPYYKGISHDHIIPKLRGHFLEPGTLKAGDGEFKKSLRCVTNTELYNRNMWYIQKIL